MNLTLSRKVKHYFDIVVPSMVLAALEKSIEKWTDIIAGTDMDKGPSCCPLCEMVEACQDCIIYNLDPAMDSNCKSIGYSDWVNHAEWIEDQRCYTVPDSSKYPDRHADAVKAAWRVLTGLQKFQKDVEIHFKRLKMENSV